MNRYNHNSTSFKKLLRSPYYLIAIMAAIIIFTTTISVYKLYKIGCQQQKIRLNEVVHSQASMINTIFKHQMHDHEKPLEFLTKEVLDNLIHAHKEFMGFGKSGEFTLAKLENDKIHFLLRHRHNEVDRMNSIPFKNSKLAEPMRRALSGQTGSFIGLDYRGVKVLAAYTPIESLNWGIVAKIDLDEIKEPYKIEAIYATLGGLLLMIIGGSLIIKITRPLAEEIEHGRNYNRLLFNKSQIGLALADLDGRLLDINPAFSKLVGYTQDELSELRYWDLTPIKYKKEEEKQLYSLKEYGSYGPYEKEYIHKDGHLFNVRLSGSLLHINGEDLIWSSVEDITKLKKNEQILKEASLVFENTHEGILITDSDVKIRRINGRFTEITGFTLEDVKGKNPSFLKSGAHTKEFYNKMWTELNEKGFWYGELNNRRKGGEYFTTLQSITAITDEYNNINGYVSVFSDITDRKNYENNLSYLATHDSLTSLANRIHFNDNFEQSISMAKRHNYKLAVLYMDLNKFKDINDTYGHETGDHLLKEVAKRFKSAVREEDTVARLGGDEFAIILNDIQNKEDIIAIAKAIIQKTSEPLSIKNHNMIPSTSIGISIYPDHAKDEESLLKYADQAMYKAKQKGPDNYEIYSE
ncbi:diguanylate cyclase domain-containing protein [Sulfurimonas sp.]|uniref:diguanylate cyclase domain-containing protein n=1 Tax=Sulfurimonas sp. TaxID=2022749 RepID=UPI003568E151